MPIRAEVGLEMVLNIGERREERRLWRLGGMVKAFCRFCTGYEDLDKCSETTTSSERRRGGDGRKSQNTRHSVSGDFFSNTNYDRVRNPTCSRPFHCANPASLALPDCASHK